MRIDHIAYRVKDRHKTVSFFTEALKYKVQDDFEIGFDNGSVAKCFALAPPEKIKVMPHRFIHMGVWDLHMAPEIFVSDGTPDSIVGKWVAERNNIGGIHHIAYQVESVKDTMKEWKEKGWAKFTTEKPLSCPGLIQCFTEPVELTGVVYEFIERDRDAQGFCQDNVKDLMLSSEERDE
mgnify:FL=1